MASQKRNTSGNRTATYKGKTYRLLYLGDTKHGYRARLGFMNGNKEFWCDGNMVKEIVASTPVANHVAAPVNANGNGHHTTPVAPVPPSDPPESTPVLVNVSQTEKDVDKTMDKTGRHGGLALRSYNAESRIKDMERVIRKLKTEGGLYIVNYYVPAELSMPTATQGIRVPNPSRWWRGIAVHLDGSNWLMTAKALESDVVQEFFANLNEYSDFIGSQGESPAYWDTPLRDDQYQKFVGMAEMKFRRMVVNIHTSLIQTIGNADQQLKDKEEEFTKRVRGEIAGGHPSEREELNAVRYRHNRVRATLKAAAEELNKAIECAERYDMTECLDDLFDGVRSGIMSQVHSFNALMGEVGLKPSDVEV
jgi:hypothetical protein